MNNKMTEETLDKKEIRREIMRQFMKFLKDRKVYVIYRENLMHTAPGRGFIRKPKNYIGFMYGIQYRVLKDYKGVDRWFTYDLAKELINYAFCWQDTPQGHSFWQRLSDAWKKHMYAKFYKHRTTLNSPVF